MTKYRSYSGFNRFNSCSRKEKYARNRKQYPPSHESAAGIIGKAVHAVIKTLHEHPEYDLDSEVESAFDYEEAMTDAPIDWGATGRDMRILKAKTMVEWYWHWNKDIDIRSSERWFYVPLPMPGDKIEWLRGRFDQIIAGPEKGLIVRELKTGMIDKNIRRDLEFDYQCLIQGYALKYGYIVIGDMPYIPVDDPKYHIHEWELEQAVEDGPDIYRCTSVGCGLRAEKFGVYPSKMIWYHIPSCVPPANALKWTRYRPDKGETAPEGAETSTKEIELKTKVRIDDVWKLPLAPRRNPAFIIEVPNENQIKFLESQLQITIMQIKACEESGIWPQTQNRTGFQSPCRFCNLIDHCDDLKCCDVKYDGEVKEDDE